MPRLEFFVVAESGAVDAMTNRLSVFNVLEAVTPLRLPGLFPSVFLAAVWCLEATEMGRDFQAHFRLHRPGEEPEDLASVNFRAEHRRQRTLLQLVGLPIPREGEFRFELLLNARHEAWHDVDVSAVPTPPPSSEG